MKWLRPVIYTMTNPIILSIVDWRSKIVLSHLQRRIESVSLFVKVMFKNERSDLT